MITEETSAEREEARVNHLKKQLDCKSTIIEQLRSQLAIAVSAFNEILDGNIQVERGDFGKKNAWRKTSDEELKFHMIAGMALKRILEMENNEG